MNTKKWPRRSNAEAVGTPPGTYAGSHSASCSASSGPPDRREVNDGSRAVGEPATRHPLGLLPAPAASTNRSPHA